MPKADPCKKLACTIQKCLSENDFQESRCIKQIDNLRECCRKFHEFSLVCSGMKPKSTKENQNKITKV
ncbi:cx9C motif-containing protein 4-like isoform X3 [Sipha flava]|uniref:Cx9C motif-containing protein 4-like isoform X3 n=1 Tax=Sipha flava TaxID=143950 RepID=A0A8B8GH51_9HEMI|nr:cx9C motif-containing protein 4-like isoform X3 [Sipha flava]